MKVFWTARAKKHLRDIHDHIALDSVEAALRVVDRITERSKQISAFPRSGRKLPHFNDDAIREIIEGNFRIVYRLKESSIDVIAVVHSARNTIIG